MSEQHSYEKEERLLEPVDLNQRFTLLCGSCWHELVAATRFKCSCDFITTYGVEFNQHIRDNPNPDFISDPRLVLREMMKREDWELFPCVSGDRHIDVDYILDTTGLLVKAGIEWLEKEKS